MIVRFHTCAQTGAAIFLIALGFLLSCANASAEPALPSIVAPPTIVDRASIFVAPSRNLIVGGSCSAQYSFRLDNLRPLGTRAEPGCSSFVVGEKSGVVLESWIDGITVNSLNDGARV